MTELVSKAESQYRKHEDVHVTLSALSSALRMLSSSWSELPKIGAVELRKMTARALGLAEKLIGKLSHVGGGEDVQAVRASILFCRI